MIRLLEALVVWLDRTAAPWVAVVHDEALAIATRRWLERMRREFPVGCIVRCRCGRCGSAGRLWRVHGYDPESCDLRVFDAAASATLLLERWPIPPLGGARPVSADVTCVSTRMVKPPLELVERPPPWAGEPFARSKRGESPE